MSAFTNLARLIKRDFIESGAYAVGSKLLTIRELATKYGYSMPTVGKSIDLLVKEGWLNKSQGSGIYIEALPEGSISVEAEALPAGKRELRIGFIASSLDVALAHDCLRGVNYTVKKNNDILEVADSNNSIDEECNQVSRMCERGIDGVVLYCLDRMHESRPEYLGREFRDTPIVVVDLYRPEMNRPHVIFDNFSAGREMTQYLLREGRRKIAFLKFSGPHAAVDQRYEGYKMALGDAGIGENVLVVDPRSSNFREELAELIRQVFAGKNVPDAIELPCDSFFVNVYSIINKLGVCVPRDVILTGTDNLWQYQDGHVWPTTVPDFMRMGMRASEMLFECIKTGVQKDSEVVLPCPIYVQHCSPKSNIVEYNVPKIGGRFRMLQSTR